MCQQWLDPEVKCHAQIQGVRNNDSVYTSAVVLIKTFHCGRSQHNLLKLVSWSWCGPTVWLYRSPWVLLPRGAEGGQVEGNIKAHRQRDTPLHCRCVVCGKLRDSGTVGHVRRTKQSVLIISLHWYDRGSQSGAARLTTHVSRGLSKCAQQSSLLKQ